MDIIKKIAFGFLGTLLLSGCQMSYYVSSAYNQFQILNSRVPVEEALQDPNLSDDEKRKLRLSQKVRDFAESELHLRKTKNYTSYVKLNRPYVTYVVSAAPKWELKHHHWTYPFVGKMPYKGFFEEQLALDEEKTLKEKDLDTYMRGVSAYSTLGWFRDPVLSSMFRYPDYDLVNTLIHETVHATIFIRNSADFNERLATFLGNKGMLQFYRQQEGESSANLKQALNEIEDDKLFSHFISREISDLEEWYKNQTDHKEENRSARIKEIQQRFIKEIEPRLKTQSYVRFKTMELNNARLMLYKTYMEDLSDFEALYVQTGQDFKSFLKVCQQLESHPEPEVGLKELIQKAPQKIKE